MRILYFGNNWLGYQVLKCLKEQGAEVVGLVIHPPRKQKYASEIRQVANLPSARVFDGAKLNNPDLIESIKSLAPDIGLAVLFDYILKPELLSIFPQGVVNLHPAYLPYNRGQYPNVWSIIEGTPSGVTLHYMDEGIDTGAIIAQKRVPVEMVDTGETLYRKLEQASLALFSKSWPLVRAGRAPRVPQSGEIGTYHRTDDVEAIDEIDLDRADVARDLINVLRARTFPSYKGAYFIANGKRVYMRLGLEYGEEELTHEG